MPLKVFTRVLVVWLLDESQSLWGATRCFRNADVASIARLSRPLHYLPVQQILFDVAHTGLLKTFVVASVKSSTVLDQRGNDCGDISVSSSASETILA